MSTYIARSHWRKRRDACHGRVSVGSGAFVSAVGRTPSKGLITNAEEMMGAALASDYLMALDRAFAEAGHEPRMLHAAAAVEKRPRDPYPIISCIRIEAVADVPGLSADQLDHFARRAKQTCAVGQALGGTPLHVHAGLARPPGDA